MTTPRRFSFCALLLLSALTAAAQEAPSGYADARRAFQAASGNPPSSWGRAVLVGRAYAPDRREAEDAVLVGADVREISGEALASGALVKVPAAAAGAARAAWVGPALAYEARLGDGEILVEARRRDGTGEPTYMAFPLPAPAAAAETAAPAPTPAASAALAQLSKSPFGPERSAPALVAAPPAAERPSGLLVGGDVRFDVNAGNTPLLNRGIEGPYVAGPGAANSLRLGWERKDQSGFFPGLELTLRQSYMSAWQAASGRADFFAKLDAAVTDKVVLEAFHRISPNINEPAGFAALSAAQHGRSDVPSTTLQQTGVGVRLTPFGRHAASGVEWYAHLSEIPGGSKKHIGPNNWPSRLRGDGNPLGWDVGMIGKYDLGDVRLPFTRVTLVRDLLISANTAILASTPFDNPEALGVGTELSGDLTRHLYFRVRNENLLNLNAGVRPDPSSDRPGSMTHVSSIGIGWRWGRSAQPEPARQPCEVGCFR